MWWRSANGINFSVLVYQRIMLAQSQGRNEQVVNSYNLFIDSAKDVGGAAGKGDSFSLQLGADSIQAQELQC